MAKKKKAKATKKKTPKKAKKESDAPKDNPSKNFAITGYLMAFPKDSETEPTLDDFNTAINQLIQTDMVEMLGINSMVMQVEIGEGGTMHLQAYIQLASKSRRSTFNKKVRKNTAFNFSIQNARGSAAQNVLYCTKPTGKWEYANGAVKMNTTLSTKPIWINKAGLVKKGERSDLAEVIRAVENGASLRELDERYPTQMVRMSRGVQGYQFRKKMSESKVERDVNLVVMYGGEGTGKSYDARHKITQKYGFTKDDIYSLQFGKGQLWFDGYNGEKVLLLDDYEIDGIHRSTLLKLSDIYQFIGQTKGGHIVAEWELVIITTNSDISEICVQSEWVDDGDGRGQSIDTPDPAFMSRISEAFNYNGMPDLRLQKDPIKITRMAEVRNRQTGLNKYLPESDVPKSVTSLLPVTLEHGTKLCLDSMQVKGATLPAGGKNTLEQSEQNGVVE